MSYPNTGGLIQTLYLTERAENPTHSPYMKPILIFVIQNIILLSLLIYFLLKTTKELYLAIVGIALVYANLVWFALIKGLQFQARSRFLQPHPNFEMILQKERTILQEGTRDSTEMKPKYLKRKFLTFITSIKIETVQTALKKYEKALTIEKNEKLL
ncbi:MAG: hypothetical protein RBG13Loki_4089 [Promethearchaeota archaeon CR_4]|nr:MAG: hypothetical protein RBG13Loki_4089 [Candidatus Lokiarchaeota archaeon CR_4]